LGHCSIELGLFPIRFRLFLTIPFLHRLFVVSEGGCVSVEFGLGSVARWLAWWLRRLGHLDLGLAEPGDDFEVR